MALPERLIRGIPIRTTRHSRTSELSSEIPARRDSRRTFVGCAVPAILCVTLWNLHQAVRPLPHTRTLLSRDVYHAIPALSSIEIESQPMEARHDINATVVDQPRRIPTILLAGAQKASTSSLAVYLMNANRTTCFSDEAQGEKGGYGKEPHFFDAKYDRGLDYYQYLFRHCPEHALLIDATPETMLHPDRVENIYNQQGTIQQLKVIFILREPVSRSISWYNHQLRHAQLPNRPAWTDLIFDQHGQIMSYIDVQRDTVVKNFEQEQWWKLYGYYAHWLRKWSQVLDRSTQILVVSYDELVQDPSSLLRRIHAFVDIPLDQATAPVLTRENTNRNAALPPCVHQLEMADYYAKLNTELYDFLDEHPGPAMEQRPFPTFSLACQPEPRIPTLLLAGAPMSGVASLANHLWHRDDTCFSDAQGYEGSVEHAHVLDADPYEAHGQLERYQQVFAQCHDADSLLIDASPGTMVHPERVKQLYDEQGISDQLRILFVIREPVSRHMAHVAWTMDMEGATDVVWTPPNASRFVTDNDPIESIERNVSTTRHSSIDYGNYAHWLRLWFEYFDRQQILVLSYHELVQDPSTFLQRVHDFLDTSWDDSDAYNLHDETAERAWPASSCADQLDLAVSYMDSNEELYQLLDESPGPEAEDRPFARFAWSCQQPTNTIIDENITDPWPPQNVDTALE